MKELTKSRGTELDNEACVANIGNRFDMVIVAAARAREIRRLNRSSVHRDHVFSEVTALLEIQKGQLGKDFSQQKAEFLKQA